MSALDINKGENDEDNKAPDKKQIEAEEKEVMLKSEIEKPEAAAELKTDAEGPVKAALSSDVIEQGREEEDGGIEKDGDNEKSDENKPRRRRFQFLHTCPFTQFLHHPQGENEDGTAEPRRGIFKLQYPKMFQKRSQRDPEATLASMETLEDKVDTPNDGMENVKLDTPEQDGKVATQLPLRERIRQRKLIKNDLLVLVGAMVVLSVAFVGIMVGALAGPPRERKLRNGRFMTTITSCGKVEGTLDQGVYNFYSIPYAVPPVGDRRFTYAEPLNLSTCWNDTLKAYERGPLCLQILENRTTIGEEDCLTLDVVTPHVRYDSPLPVVVLIGANTLTGGISPAQPSALYARTKEVVFVRPNFRLGPFGFLALDILAKTKYPPTSGNYALSDLLAALQWVHYNIKHFGGDPKAVTLMGHRAGATLTAAISTNKKAQKFYSKVWLSSPSVVFPTIPLDQAQKNNEQFKQLSRCDDVDCLRRMDISDILSSTPDTWSSDNVGTLPQADEIRHSWLILDGDFLRIPVPESWIEQRQMTTSFNSYLFSRKDRLFRPIVLGTTQHSGHSELLRMKHLNWTSQMVEQVVNESIIGQKQLSSSVFAHFNQSYEGLSELIASVRTLCPLVNLTQSVRGTALYVVLGSGAGGGAAGSGIAGINSDVEAILGTFYSDMPEQRRFMAAMQQLFYYYVWHGHLAGPETNLIAVGQDLLPLQDLPACRLLFDKGLVPMYAHID